MRTLRRLRLKTKLTRSLRRNWDSISLLLASLAGVLLAAAMIRGFNDRVEPILGAAAQLNVRNAVNRIVTDAVGRTLTDEAVAYRDMITLEKDNSGQITALTSNTLAMNRLRTEIMRSVLEQLDTLDSHALGVPLGELTGLAVLSGRGPVLPVRLHSVGAASAEFKNVFLSGGFNQTCHRVMLEVTVEAALLIPGGTTTATVSTQVCVAETVLVGEVPQTYLQLSPGGP